MSPPKCFFKRPRQFYETDGAVIENHKYGSHSFPALQFKEFFSNATYGDDDDDDFSVSSVNMKTSVLNVYENSLSDLFKNESTKKEPIDSPLDLSCKILFPENRENLWKNFNHYYQQQKLDANILSNLNLNLKSLFFPITTQINSSIALHLSENQSELNRDTFIPPTIKSDMLCKTNQNLLEKHLMCNDKSCEEFSVSRSPENSLTVIDSGQENSSSETSSHCPASQRRKRANKRCIKEKIIRPFKLYKENDSKSILEALGVTEQNEEWLRSLIEKKNVDDIFQFLTNVMNNKYKEGDLSKDVLEAIKLKFGQIFENCNSSISNPRMVRHPDMTPKEMKTEEYWEKRRKNNEAAKRSREARRQKEEGLTNHCEDLQIENNKIRKEIEHVKLQIEDVKKHFSRQIS